MYVCTGCGAGLGEQGSFCPECGTPRQPPACPACGAPSSGGKFCAECGTSLAASPRAQPAQPARPPAASIAERRLTSILFGDLVGFTPLSESRDPEDVRELLSRYFEEARTIVGRYGGTVEKFIGDAVMAVWGVPVAHEDDAERAVRAGLDLAAMVTQLGEEVGAELWLRVGVTTGEVAVTIGAVAEGMVAGDAVNTAARVQSAAAPGSVWVDEGTRGLAAAAIAFEDVGEHALKGKSEPVRLFQAVAVVASVGSDKRSRGLEPPFTGRGRQLRLVKELLHDTVDESKPRMVLVSGPAGVGKSRLAWEFEKYIDGLNDVFAWHRGRCLSYGDGSAFGALGDVVRMRLGAADGTPAADRVAELLPDELERSWVAPRLDVLLGSGEQASFELDDLFAAWTRFLERAGKGGPVIVVLEDAHFATSALLDFLEHLLATARHAIYVVALARPELLERRPELLTSRRVTALHLEPLQDEPMRALLDGVVAGLTDDIRTTLVQRAEGIPLYAVETVRALLDRGLVVGQEGRYRLADGQVDLTAIGAPASLHALVASRLDALPADERRLVGLASVLGVSFMREALDALDASGEDIDDVVAGLIRRDVLTVQTDRFDPDRGYLRFVQSVVRQVAYGTLSRRDRRAAHLAAADFIEHDDPAGELAPVVAQHVLDAVALSAEGDEGVDMLRGRAADLLLAAAERALDVGAADVALQHLRVAEESIQEPEQRLVVQEALARAAFAAGDLDACVEHSLRVLDALGDREPERAAAVAAMVGLAYNSADRMNEAIALLEPRLAALGEDPVSPAALAVLSELSRAVHYLGIDGSERYEERHLDVAERLGEPAGIAEALQSVAHAWFKRGRQSAGTALMRGAVDHARRAGQPQLLVRILLNAAANDLADDLPGALALSSEAVELAPRASATWRFVAKLNWGIGALVAGRWDELRDLIDEMSATTVEHRGAEALRVIAGWLAEAAGEEFGASEPDVHEAADLMIRAWVRQSQLLAARASGDRDAVIETALRAAEVTRAAFPAFDDDFPILWPGAVLPLLDVGAIDEAAAEIEKVATPRTGTLRALTTAQLLRMQGLLAAARDEDAESPLREAIAALDAFGAVPDAARTKHVLGEWLLALGRAHEAAVLLDEARTTYEHLGATRWLAGLPGSVGAPG